MTGRAQPSDELRAKTGTAGETCEYKERVFTPFTRLVARVSPGCSAMAQNSPVLSVGQACQRQNKCKAAKAARWTWSVCMHS